ALFISYARPTRDRVYPTSHELSQDYDRQRPSRPHVARAWSPHMTKVRASREAHRYRYPRVTVVFKSCPHLGLAAGPPAGGCKGRPDRAWIFGRLKVVVHG
ncbi:hypothetical protein Dimus_007833, partial [Dionaea muscipula]